MSLSRIHSQRILPRRQRVLAQRLAPLVPPGSSVLDVGTGDGAIASAIQQANPGVRVTGLDVLVRSQTAIPVVAFDGTTIPFPDNSHDVVLFVDVLHHTPDPQALLDEAARVARRLVIIKDHHRTGFLAGTTLRLMDWVGNARFGVALPYNYWTPEEWAVGYRKAGLEVVECQQQVGLYPFWADWLFGRKLHAIVVLKKRNPMAADAGSVEP